MLTKEIIRKRLLNDPLWEPHPESSGKEWELFDEVYEGMEQSGELDGLPEDPDDSWPTDDDY